MKIVALGDSLTAGYGLPDKDGFVPQLQAALTTNGRSVEIQNAGVSGDTASDGLARLDWSVPQGTDAVIVELGANDMLRGINPEITRGALDTIVQPPDRAPYRGSHLRHACRAKSWAEYGQAFERIYPELAAKYGARSIRSSSTASPPIRGMTQHDGLHPNAEGVGVIVAAHFTESAGIDRRGASATPVVRVACVIRSPHAGCVTIRERRAREFVMPRLFTGLEIPPSVAQSLDMMRGGLPGARWIDPENYHLTLRFIGDIDDALAHEIAGMLGRVQRRPSNCVSTD